MSASASSNRRCGSAIVMSIPPPLTRTSAKLVRASKNSGLPRDQVFVTTKVWYTHLTPADLLRSARESLAKLKLDYVDLLLIHWPNSSVPLDQTIAALCKAKRDGMAKNIGDVELHNGADRSGGAATRPNRSPRTRSRLHPYLDQSKLVAACAESGIAVTAYSPIARGKTGGDPVLEKIGRAHKKSEAQVSLRFLIQQGIIVIPRTSKVERLSENAEIFDFELSPSEMAEIRAVAKPDGRMISPSWAPAWDR